MKNGLLKTTVAFLFAVAMSFSMFASQAWALGGFSQSCPTYSLDESMLYALCKKSDGDKLYPAFIDLNIYIENVDGALEWQPDNFIETCENVRLYGASELIADCKTRAGYWASSKIDLDDHIANINGVLTYE